MRQSTPRLDRGGGYPISGLGRGWGTPSQVGGGGVPHLRSEGGTSPLSGGVPSPTSGGVPSLRSGGRGVPHLRSGRVPHLRSGGYPILGLEGTPSQV